ncbi:MAG: DUF3352 domain-containing protein [Desulfobulbaceae bacterium]
MKKTGVILGAVCILAAVLYFLVTARMGKVTAVDFLPTDVLISVEQRDFGTLIDDFKVSRLGLAMAGIDYVKIATDLDLDPEKINTVRDSRKQLEEFLNNPLFKEFFGREFTLALLPRPDLVLDAPDKSVANSFLFIAKPRHNADILELLSSIFAKKLEQTSIQHGEYSLKQYVVEEGTTLTVATVEGYVIAAFDEQRVQASLDRFDDQQASLAQNKEYTRLRHEFIGAKLFTYVSMPALYGQADRWAEHLEQPQKEEIQKAIVQWKGWEGLAFGAWKEKGEIRNKVVVLFTKEKLDPLVGKMCAVQPVENKTLAMVPADILGYYWTNTLNLSAFWEIFTQEMKDSEEQIQAMEQDVKTFTGLELQQIFEMFGSETVFLLKEIATDGFIPLPNGAIFLKIEKEDEFVKMVEPMLSKADISTQVEEYKGVKLISWGVSLHPGLQPVYVLHQGYLILATTVDLVKKIIDSPAGEVQGSADTAGSVAKGKSGALVKDKSFQQINEGLNQGLNEVNNSVSFVRFSSLLQMIKELASWGGVMLSMQDRETALKSTVVLEQLILPLLDGLAMYEVIGARSVIKGDAIILESTTILAH